MLLAIVAAVLIYFMPTGIRRERTVRNSRKAPKTYRKAVKQRTKLSARAQSSRVMPSSRGMRGASSQTHGMATRNIGWAHVEDFDIAPVSPTVEVAEEREPLPRLPDPLTARLGEIEKVEWAKVIRLAEIKTDEENNLSSETLDEILRRRRAN